MRTHLKLFIAVGCLLLFGLGYHYRFHLMFYVAGQRAYSKNIAFCFLDGKNGFNPNYQKARYWLEVAANNGDGESMGWLAWMVDSGRGGNLDHNKALYWYHEAQKHGDKQSESYLRNRHLLN
jgi:TPR repeat protein